MKEKGGYTREMVRERETESESFSQSKFEEIEFRKINQNELINQLRPIDHLRPMDPVN